MSNYTAVEQAAYFKYLGDAVIASFDGYHVWLRTDDGSQQAIALAPEVVSSLRFYFDTIHSRVARAERDSNQPEPSSA